MPRKKFRGIFASGGRENGLGGTFGGDAWFLFAALRRLYVERSGAVPLDKMLVSRGQKEVDCGYCNHHEAVPPAATRREEFTMTHSLRVLCAGLALALPLTCYGADTAGGKTDEAQPAAAPQAVPAEKAEPKGPEAGHTAHEAPPAAPETKAAENISGKVLQTMNSGGYSYVYVEGKEQKVWVAVPQTKVRVGDVMTFKPGMEMVNFPSTSLKRTFDRIIFSEGVVSSSGGKEPDTSPGAGGAVTSGGKIKVEKASGANAYTVSELYGKSAKLHQKKVVVRGQVVKVSANIMGKNWIHVQDGSGSAKKGTNNLVVTSTDIPTVGDVVTVTGTLYKDKDFGGNYKYKVIVEDATVQP
jgi:hypothetical protein